MGSDWLTDDLSNRRLAVLAVTIVSYLAFWVFILAVAPDDNHRLFADVVMFGRLGAYLNLSRALFVERL